MDSNPSPTTQGSAAAGSSSSRKERGPIASQACDLCRGRKQRCDEARPRCGNCQRLNVECVYREPLPTKKDNTLQDIQRRVANVEKMMGELVASLNTLPVAQDLTLRPIQDLSSSREAFNSSRPLFDDSRSQFSADTRVREHEFFVTPSTKYMLDWPVLKHLPATTQVKDKGVKGKALPFPAPPAASLDEDQQPLNTDGITLTPYATGPSTPASFHYPTPSVVQPTVASVVGWETVQPLSKGYFDTFNQLHPIVDENWFMNDTVGHIMNSVENTPASALGFLVLALGEVALSGNTTPISQVGTTASGIRSSTINKPPGLAFFNEARHRMGLFSTEVSVENLQVKCLAAMYFASSGRAGDCWRMAASATIICQTLVTRIHEVTHASAELIRRLFHHCAEVTFVLRSDLHLPMTDLEHLRAHVGLPEFAGGQSEEAYLANQTSQFSSYSQAQVFIYRFFSSLYRSLEDVATSNRLSETPEPTQEKIQYFNTQLEHWREMLPQYLSWEDGQFLGFDPIEPAPQLLITNNLMDDTMAYPYISMMQIALIRSLYSLGRHMLFRYYVYRVLHHPDSLGPEDYTGAAECLKAALKWPITMTPPSMNKRLIPLPFYWSQNICGALILLRLSQQDLVLSHVRTNFCGQGFDYELAETTELYIQWLRDMKRFCAASERSWNIIRALYNLDD